VGVPDPGSDAEAMAMVLTGLRHLAAADPTALAAAAQAAADPTALAAAAQAAAAQAAAAQAAAAQAAAAQAAAAQAAAAQAECLQSLEQALAGGPAATPLAPSTPQAPFARWIRLSRWIRATPVATTLRVSRIHRGNFRMAEPISEDGCLRGQRDG
jgi:hypothetical protein